MIVDPNNGVLLQTAQASLSSPSSEESTKIRLIFDNCSQRSYITESTQKRMNLPVTGSDTLMIKTFADTAAKLRKCDIVQCAIETVDHMKIFFSAFVVPVICSPISQRTIEFAQMKYPISKD